MYKTFIRQGSVAPKQPLSLPSELIEELHHHADLFRQRLESPSVPPVQVGLPRRLIPIPQLWTGVDHFPGGGTASDDDIQLWLDPVTLQAKGVQAEAKIADPEVHVGQATSRTDRPMSFSGSFLLIFA